MILIKATKQAKNKLLWLSSYTLWLKTARMIQKVQKTWDLQTGKPKQ